MKDINNIGFKISNTYKTLPKKFYTNSKKSQFPKPELLIFNYELSKDLGINIEGVDENLIAGLFSANIFLEGEKPISQAYAGHQFGYFTMLGDGRAILVGEHTKPDGKIVDIQLKGSGRTVYSRGGDGKAVLSPMLREYLISEAMYYLKVPTTRSLAVVKTGENIYRNTMQEGAVLTRVADSHIRVGTFEFASMDEKNDIKKLADYTIKRHYPNVKRYEEFIKKVVQKQAMLIAKWQNIGFIHGVMNTDNMAISGQTIDYGPCAFMDEYDPKTVFSSIDRNGRYRYENQPSIAQWNLARFAETLLPFINDDKDKAIKIATQIITDFTQKFSNYWSEEMRKKLGFFSNIQGSDTIIKELLSLMQVKKADFTNTFVRLTLQANSKEGTYLEGTKELFKSEEFNKWYIKWEEKINLQEKTRDEIYNLMKNSNPFVIPRNFIVQEVLNQAQEGNMIPFEEFLTVLKNPYNYDIVNKKYQQLPKEPSRNYKTYCGT